MESCESTSFSKFNSCIKSNGDISNTKGLALAYLAYDETIGASNRRKQTKKVRVVDCSSSQYKSGYAGGILAAMDGCY